MKLKLVKDENKLVLVMDGKVSGEVTETSKFGCDYKVTMNDGKIIYGVSKKALLNIVKNQYSKEVE